MKKLIAPLAVLVFSTTCFATIDQTKYSNVLGDIKKAEAAKDYKTAALKAAVAANSLADEIHFDETVKSIKTTLTQSRAEVVTSSTSDKAGLNIFFLLSASAFEKYDSAKILTTNPEEVADFSRKQAADFNRLQRDLSKYIKKNGTGLFYAKVFSAKALQLTAKMQNIDVPQVYGYVTKTAQRVSAVSFSGAQDVINCTSTDYANRSSSAGFNISILFSSLNLSTKTKQYAHNETSCNSSVAYAENSEQVINSVNLMVADESLEIAEDTLSLKMLTMKAPSFPSWGSSYLD